SFFNGFFKTGDFGYFDKNGFLVITNRKKDLIKTSSGKYVVPQKIINLFKKHPFISHVHLHGDNKKYIVALITLNQKLIEAYAHQHNIAYRNYQSLIKTPEIRSLVQGIVKEVNKDLPSHETIKYFYILPYDFSVETGELTPSLKVKRSFCDKKYKKIIDSLYELS
ncbi:MAG: long-chain fatty acid--CoA ligase, partial [Bdellovibrio sp.]